MKVNVNQFVATSYRDAYRLAKEAVSSPIGFFRGRSISTQATKNPIFTGGAGSSSKIIPGHVKDLITSKWAANNAKEFYESLEKISSKGIEIRFHCDEATALKRGDVYYRENFSEKGIEKVVWINANNIEEFGGTTTLFFVKALAKRDGDIDPYAGRNKLFGEDIEKYNNFTSCYLDSGSVYAKIIGNDYVVLDECEEKGYLKLELKNEHAQLFPKNQLKARAVQRS